MSSLVGARARARARARGGEGGARVGVRARARELVSYCAGARVSSCEDKFAKASARRHLTIR
eukprot:5909155-Pleurochrysis_carterae.AAC.2